MRQPAIERALSGGPATARFDLIETMLVSAQGGVALLDFHLSRLSASADVLGFACDAALLRRAVIALCSTATVAAKLRLVLARSGAYTLEMAEMPVAMADPVPCVVLPLPVDPGDWRLRHKSSDRAFYAAGLRVAGGLGAGEALFIGEDGLLTEGCFTSIFVPRDGVWLTPPAGIGLLPGVLRAAMLADGRAREAELRLDDLANGFAIGNALRGLMPACLLELA